MEIRCFLGLECILPDIYCIIKQGIPYLTVTYNTHIQNHIVVI